MPARDGGIGQADLALLAAADDGGLLLRHCERAGLLAADRLEAKCVRDLLGGHRTRSPVPIVPGGSRTVHVRSTLRDAIFLC